MVDAPDWFAAPMLCKAKERDELDKPALWKAYVAEPKHDGARCLVDSRSGSVKLYSRSGQDFTDHVHEDLLADLNAWVPPNSIVDGELAIIDRHFDISGRRVPVANFNATMRILGSKAERGRSLQPELGVMSIIVYDLLKWNGFEGHDAPLSVRRSGLKQVFPFGSQRIFLNPQFGDPARFGELYDTLIGHGVEGIIVKNSAAPYVFDGRPNKTWYKVKAAITLDMVVTGYTEGTGKYEGLIGAVEFGRWVGNGEGDNGSDIVHVSRCSGMTDTLRRDISANRDAYLGRVIEVKSNELVGSKEYRTPRHPQFVAFRTDKLPEQCLGEELTR